MFRFSIRELMLVTLVVALGFGWWAHWRSLEANRRAIIQHAEKLKEVLAVAKEQEKDLKEQADFIRVFKEESSKPGSNLSGFSHISMYHDVNWAILNEPIPGQ